MKIRQAVSSTNSRWQALQRTISRFFFATTQATGASPMGHNKALEGGRSWRRQRHSLRRNLKLPDGSGNTGDPGCWTADRSRTHHLPPWQARGWCSSRRSNRIYHRHKNAGIRSNQVPGGECSPLDGTLKARSCAVSSDVLNLGACGSSTELGNGRSGLLGQFGRRLYLESFKDERPIGSSNLNGWWLA